MICFSATIAFCVLALEKPRNIPESTVPIGPPTKLKPYLKKQKQKKMQLDEPEWFNYPPIRQVSNLGKVLGDIESHMPAGHIYRDNDKITWAHETSHGLASNIRSIYHGASEEEGLTMLIDGKPVIVSRGYNGFYVLENRAIIIKEPLTTVSAAARLVPSSLRGMSYQLYMINQAASWNDSPLYIFDEWVAYANGSATRADLKITNRGETVQQMLEFSVYAICLAMSCKTEDLQFKKFLKWHLTRAMDLYKINKQIGNILNCDQYLINMRQSSDAGNLRSFAKSYLGEDFTSKTLGF